MEKVSGIASSLAIILAIVAAFVAIPGVDAGLVLLILGIIGGLSAAQDGAVRTYLAVLVLPAVGAALGVVPAAGEYLTAIFGNLAIIAAGVAATLVARVVYEKIMGTISSFTGEDS